MQRRRSQDRGGNRSPKYEVDTGEDTNLDVPTQKFLLCMYICAYGIVI